MEGILAFIVIICSVIAAANGNKKNKKQSARTRPTTPAQRAAAQRMPKTAPVPRVDRTPFVPPVEMDEGDSLTDGVCVGGSMEHTEHQGESADDGICLGGSLAHDTHEGAETPMPVLTQETEGTASEDARFTAQDMRNAFIASEIFARPKALRRS